MTAMLSPTAARPASFVRAVLLAGLCAACSSKPTESAAPPSTTATPGAPVAAHKAPAPAPPRPSFAKRRLLLAQGKTAFGTGEWDVCTRLFETAQAWPEAARCAAHTRDLARSLEDVERALVHGEGLEQLRDDPDLAVLTRDPKLAPRWQAVIRDAEAERVAYRARLNVELDQLARADEPAGQPPKPPKLATQADAQLFAARIPRVAEIVAAGGATLADDFAHAAMVYYRADTVDDAMRAHELALEALKREPDRDDAKWLAAASEDRRLKHEGKPQRFGTQLVVEAGKLSLWNIDPAVSDAERARWSVPSLAEAIAGDLEAGAGSGSGSQGSAEPYGPL